MTMKHRGVKIVPVRTTRFEVRTVDGHKMKTFGSTTSAKAWIDGYMKAYTDLAPRTAAPKPVEAPVEKPKRRRRTVEAAAPASE